MQNLIASWSEAGKGKIELVVRASHCAVFHFIYECMVLYIVIRTQIPPCLNKNSSSERRIFVFILGRTRMHLVTLSIDIWHPPSHHIIESQNCSVGRDLKDD